MSCGSVDYSTGAALRFACASLSWVQRLTAEAVCRSWREALGDPSLWRTVRAGRDLTPLPTLLARHGHCLEELLLEVSCGGLRWLPKGLASCSQLRRLELRGLCRASFRSTSLGTTVPSLQQLLLEYKPYFVLGRLDHDTGAGDAAISAQLLASAFPALEQLSCEYLWLGASNKLDVCFPRLQRLSLVAVTRDQEAQWNSRGCSRDLASLARLAPGLEALELRDPRLNVNRCSFRWSTEGIKELVDMCRHFCGTQPKQLLDLRQQFPKLRELHVETALCGPSGLDLAGIDGVALRVGTCNAEAGHSYWAARTGVIVTEPERSRLALEILSGWERARMLQSDSDSEPAVFRDPELLVPEIACTYAEGCAVEWRDGETWIATRVLQTDPDGAVLLDSAPDWIPQELQAASLRPGKEELSPGKRRAVRTMPGARKRLRAAR